MKFFRIRDGLNMQEEMEKCGKRAVTCKNWQLIPGMQIVHPAEDKGGTGYVFRVNREGFTLDKNEYPDFMDPATRGCLLELVRSAWKNGEIYVRPEYNQSSEEIWTCFARKQGRSWLVFMRYTEVEALLDALEKAPNT